MTEPPITETIGRQVLQKTARGIFWNFVAYGVSKGVVFVTTAILARLLSRDDFGIVALAVVAINYLSVVKDLGLGVALIQRREDVDRAANTVFTLNLIFGILLSASLIPLAPLVAEYFKTPMVTPVLRWLGLTFFIGAIGSVHVVWLMRDLDFRRKLIPDMGGALFKAVISIGLALAGYGVWALVFGQLIGVLASVILFWVMVPWRPRFMLDPKITRGLLAYGSSIISSDIINVSIDNLGYIVIGRLYGAVQLGVYTLAYRLPEMLLMGNLWIMASVTFPAFANIQEDMDSMRKGFLGSIRLVELIAVPVCLGLIIAAEPIILVVFGSQWLDAIPLLRILSLYVLVASVAYHVGDVYKAIGKPHVLLNMTILTLVLMALSLFVGSRFGLAGIAWAYVTAFFIERVLSFFLITHYVQISLKEIFIELLPSIKGGLVMAPAALLVLYSTTGFDPVWQLVCIVAAGVVSYLGVLWLTEKDNLIQLVQVIRNRA
ncbi:MAG: lipopolysaccharide biosynthesis protein [Anaerolineaceae bacterium]|jgi:O-antigen/teichoic acid export membrane protein|nr:MAG: lipopolysaccharide biosynthesis protein [Anaerolineaceae bacterium]